MTQLAPVTAFDVRQVAQQFGTPVWVYDQKTIETRISEVQCFDVVRYAQKANSNLAILKTMKNKGVVVDAVSAGEIVRALKVGYTGQGEHPGVVFTADLFDRDALELIKEHKIPVNCGSIDMIRQLAETKIDVPVTLRLNPGFGHGHSQKTNTGGDVSKHGIWIGQLEECLQVGKDLGIRIEGLHMHIGSGTDFEHLSQVAGAMVDAARRFGTNLKVISAGGGLPIPYKKDQPARINVQQYFEIWDTARKQIEAELGHKITLEVEPGRYLIAESGYLVTEIRATKKQDQRGFYLVDAGFNDLVRPAFYGSWHHITVVPATGAVATEVEDVVVAGPLCESGDVFTQEEGGFVTSRSLPKSQVGDYLILHDAGAYGMAMGSNYNTRKTATEVLVRPNGALSEIRVRQSFESIFQFEQIPSDL
jgi:diaminopimelate decarboxylase